MRVTPPTLSVVVLLVCWSVGDGYAFHNGWRSRVVGRGRRAVSSIARRSVAAPAADPPQHHQPSLTAPRAIPPPPHRQMPKRAAGAATVATTAASALLPIPSIWSELRTFMPRAAAFVQPTGADGGGAAGAAAEKRAPSGAWRVLARLCARDRGVVGFAGLFLALAAACEVHMSPCSFMAHRWPHHRAAASSHMRGGGAGVPRP